MGSQPLLIMMAAAAEASLVSFAAMLLERQVPLHAPVPLFTTSL
jgi:hypothetical protein